MYLIEPFVNYIIQGLYNTNKTSGNTPPTPTKLKYFPLQTPDANNPLDTQGSGTKNETTWMDNKSWDDSKYWFDDWYIEGV